ncbi:hypothetical protein D3C78_1935610 [compost metagenome]
MTIRRSSQHLLAFLYVGLYDLFIKAFADHKFLQGLHKKSWQAFVLRFFNPKKRDA